MIEKRFILTGEEEQFLFDNDDIENLSHWTANKKSIVKLMNSLNDEIKNLKVDNDYLIVLLASIKEAFEENSILTKTDFEKIIKGDDVG